MRFLLGGYTADMGGTAEGVGVLHAGEAAEQSPRGSLTFAGTASRVSSPSWLAMHPTLDVVYAALEGEGAVRAFSRSGASLRSMGQAVSVGEITCHVAVAPDASHLVAANYGDGTVARVALAADGSLGALQHLAQAVDPYAQTDSETVFVLDAGSVAADDQKAVAGSGREDAIDLAAAAAALRAAAGAEFAHLIPEYEQAPQVAAEAEEEPTGRVSRAHHARFVDDGLMVTTDLGFDLVRVWRRGRELQSVTLPRGTGPRHSVWHPSGHLYVVTEYSAEVFVLAPDRAGTWRLVSATTVAREARFGIDAPAEISLTVDGLFLHVGVRGSNTIATLAVRDGGARLEPVALAPSGVDWPRHHVVVGDTMLVAGQRSETVVSLDVDSRTGVVGAPRFTAYAPTPSAILPLFD